MPSLGDWGELYHPSWGSPLPWRASLVDQPAALAGNGCFATVGMIGGRQDLSLGNGCSTGNAIHEIGHTIGFRHSDYYNRAISCGSGGNEGDSGVGAILIPGTPSSATVGGSIMNSCFRSTETGEFTSSDVTALNYLYYEMALQPPGFRS